MEFTFNWLPRIWKIILVIFISFSYKQRNSLSAIILMSQMIEQSGIYVYMLLQ